MPAEDFHQRGLAGAVAADQANVVVVGDQPVDVFEEKFVAEAFSGAGKLDHGTANYRLTNTGLASGLQDAEL